MNYTYIEPSLVFSDSNTPVDSSGPGVIIMLLSPTTRKTTNLISNPRVSLLVHDWVSHRPSTSFTDPTNATPSSPGGQQPSSLAELLLNLNSSSISTHSHTIRGYARIIEANSEEEKYYKQKHVEGNRGEENSCYIEGDEDSRVVVVDVEGGRVADWHGGVNDWGHSDGGPPTNGSSDPNGTTWLSNGV